LSQELARISSSSWPGCQLAGLPARVAKGDEGFFGPAACGYCVQHIAGKCQLYVVGNTDRVFILVAGVVQHEAFLGADGSAEHHRTARRRRVGAGDRELLEQPAERQAGGAIDHDAEGAVLVVFTNQGHGGREVRIRHAGHGDQQLVGQVADVDHAANSGSPSQGPRGR